MPAQRYRIVVRGSLGPRYAAAFDRMTAEPFGSDTAIVGPVADQAQLQGVLERVAALHLELVSVNPIDDE